MINWATSPHVKRLNMAFLLVDEKRADLSERLTSNPHVASIEVPLPPEAERVRFINATVDPIALKAFSDYDATQLATLTAGISLTDLNVMVQSARESGRRLDSKVFRELKKLHGADTRRPQPVQKRCRQRVVPATNPASRSQPDE
jgi:hypothetical protein